MKKHNLSEYGTFHNMIRRCERPENNPKYKNHGGRGITVCERWHIFDNFLADMGPKPTQKHTLERRDNDKGYYPENCYWATRKQQGRNTRVTHNITAFGLTACMKDWAGLFGIGYAQLRHRLKRTTMTPEQALTWPRNKKFH